MKYTGNYNLKKPEGSDTVNIDDLNYNFDIIDQALKNHEDNLATKETPTGAQAKADTAEANAKVYTDAHEQKAAPHSGHETPAGAQAKANAAETNAKNHANSLVGTLSNLLTTAKNNTVAAINEIFGKVGNVEDGLESHKDRHASGGPDALTPADIGAAAASHAHGNISSDGKIGSTANCAIYTGTNGVLQAGTLPIAAGGTGATSASTALSNLGGVPVTRTINGRQLSSNLTLGKYDVGLGNVDNVKQMPVAGGTFTGVVYAQSNTSYTTAQIRNIVLSTSDPSGGNDGEIWIKYQ